MTKKIPKGDLAAAKAEAAAARAQLKAFRHEVSLLKKKGLIDKKKYDARSATPTKYLKSQIKKFSDVLAGTSQTVKVSKAKQAQYKERGYKVKNGRVVVPVAINEKVLGTHGDFVVKTSGEFGSITRVDLGLNKKDIVKWKEQLRAKHTTLRDGESIYFQFYGNNSYQTFQTFEQLVDYLEFYKTVEDVEMKGSAEDHMDLIENIVIFRINRGSKKPPRQSQSDEAVTARRKVLAERRQKSIDRMSPERRAVYNEDRAKAEKDRRAKKAAKETPEQAEARKKKARERAKKSYQSQAKTNGKKGNSGN